jgi:hypothetical protein
MGRLENQCANGWHFASGWLLGRGGTLPGACAANAVASRIVFIGVEVGQVEQKTFQRAKFLRRRANDRQNLRSPLQ